MRAFFLVGVVVIFSQYFTTHHKCQRLALGLTYQATSTQHRKVKGKQMPKYEVEVQLSGNDGNAFSIMASVKNALKKAGASKEEIDQYISDSMAGDYDNLLRVAMDWVEVA
jgi:hypothetical protein